MNCIDYSDLYYRIIVELVEEWLAEHRRDFVVDHGNGQVLWRGADGEEEDTGFEDRNDEVEGRQPGTKKEKMWRYDINIDRLTPKSPH